MCIFFCSQFKATFLFYFLFVGWLLLDKKSSFVLVFTFTPWVFGLASLQSLSPSFCYLTKEMCMIWYALSMFKKEKGIILSWNCCFLCRKRLFSMINELPTTFEIVAERKHVKEKLTADSGSKSRGSTKVLFTLIKFLIVSLSVRPDLTFVFSSSLMRFRWISGSL